MLGPSSLKNRVSFRSWVAPVLLISLCILKSPSAWSQENEQRTSLPVSTGATPSESIDEKSTSPYVVVLGNAQDAGYPQIECEKDCCKPAWKDPTLQRWASSLAIVDPQSKSFWLLDCTPDIKHQLRLAKRSDLSGAVHDLQGVFVTHAHIGHYLGLAQLGREALGARGVKVFAMPRLSEFLQENGPWGQLVRLGNIQLQPLRADVATILNERLSVRPILVPHRDEYSETVGFIVEGPGLSVLYLPDIDKWDRWDRSIVELVSQVDLAYLDGTFFADGELPGRDMSKIPHPFIRESLGLFESMELADRRKIRFIHLNHTNPALRPDSRARMVIREHDAEVAEQGDIFVLEPLK